MPLYVGGYKRVGGSGGCGLIGLILIGLGVTLAVTSMAFVIVTIVIGVLALVTALAWLPSQERKKDRDEVQREDGGQSDRHRSGR